MSICYSMYVDTVLEPQEVRDAMCSKFGWRCQCARIYADKLVMWVEDAEALGKKWVMEHDGFCPTTSVVFQVDKYPPYTEGYLNMGKAVVAVLSMVHGDASFSMDEVPLLLRRNGRLIRFMQAFWTDDLLALLPPHETKANPVADDLE